MHWEDDHHLHFEEHGLADHPSDYDDASRRAAARRSAFAVDRAARSLAEPRDGARRHAAQPRATGDAVRRIGAQARRGDDGPREQVLAGRGRDVLDDARGRRARPAGGAGSRAFRIERAPENAAPARGRVGGPARVVDRRRRTARRSQVFLADGPHGVRKERVDALGLASAPATCFPTASSLGSAWDPDLAASVGRALGVEARAQGVDVLLGPGINIKRHPLGGRNFESAAAERT